MAEIMTCEPERASSTNADKEAALSELHDALQAALTTDPSLPLWKAIIAFKGYPFTTSGRGSRPGIKFTYEVSKPSTGGGRRYAGVQVEGYGNELWITTATDKVRKKKSISRSTVDLALRTALEMGGSVPGPRKLNVPGAHSYLYAMLLRFGVITNTDSSALGDGYLND